MPLMYKLERSTMCAFCMWIILCPKLGEIKFPKLELVDLLGCMKLTRTLTIDFKFRYFIYLYKQNRTKNTRLNPKNMG